MTADRKARAIPVKTELNVKLVTKSRPRMDRKHPDNLETVKG